MKPPALPRTLPLGGMVLAVILAAACGRPATTSTPTPDIPVLETRVAFALEGTLTAKAPPTWTPTVTPIPPTATPTEATMTPSPALTPTPGPTGAAGDLNTRLAYVRLGQDRSANVALHSDPVMEDAVLTHLVEPFNMSDVAWSRDGNTILFVSAHDFVRSRDNERNVFFMRPDGTELRMITGVYTDPAHAPGPYATLMGQVMGGQGECLVSAQGVASPVLADSNGVFSLPGVPLSATWVRAVCQADQVTLQGGAQVVAEGDTLTPVAIPVEAKGQGWTQASLSRDGTLLAGTHYRWSLNAQGAKTYVMSGVITTLTDTLVAEVELPASTTLMGLDWSPVDDTLVGGLTGAKSTWLWRWDAQGKSLGAIVEIPNTDKAVLSAINPTWSPDGTQIAFGLRQWHLWEENQSRTELAVFRLGEAAPRVVGSTDWGRDAGEATWSRDGGTVFYEVADRVEGDESWTKANGRIWVVSPSVEGATPRPWPEDEERYLPAVDPS